MSTNENTIFRVYYDLNGGSGDFEREFYVTSGETITITDAYPSHTDYIFCGWEKHDGIVYQAGDAVTITGDLVFTAVWYEEAYYTLSFNLNGGTGPFYGVTLAVGDIFPIPEEIPTKQDYIFLYWVTEDGKALYPGECTDLP